MDHGNEPFFIVGASRSGTTLLRLMLNAHSRLLVPRELQYFNVFDTYLRDLSWRDTALSDQDFAALVDRFFAVRADVVKHLDLPSLRNEILQAPGRDLRTPYTYVLAALASSSGKQRWGEKTPKNFYYVDILIDMFPRARFIHLMRDPRATVNSMNNVDYYSRDTALNALNWKHATEQGGVLLETHVPHNQKMLLRYEDLVQDPERMLSEVLDFLGEDFEPEMLAFHKTTGSNMPDVIRTTTLERPVESDHAEKWRSQLRREEVAVIESVCHTLMDKYQYPSTNEALDWKSTIDLALKKSYWKMQVRRNRETRAAEVAYEPFGRLRRKMGRFFVRRD